jgi:hypothetical protein
LYENRLREEDLRGLQEEKMKSIRSFPSFSETTRPDLHSERYRLFSSVENKRLPLQSFQDAIHQPQLSTMAREEEMVLARSHDSLDGPECSGMVP